MMQPRSNDASQVAPSDSRLSNLPIISSISIRSLHAIELASQLASVRIGYTIRSPTLLSDTTGGQRLAPSNLSKTPGSTPRKECWKAANPGSRH